MSALPTRLRDMAQEVLHDHEHAVNFSALVGLLEAAADALDQPHRRYVHEHADGTVRDTTCAACQGWSIVPADRVHEEWRVVVASKYARPVVYPSTGAYATEEEARAWYATMQPAVGKREGWSPVVGVRIERRVATGWVMREATTIEPGGPDG